MILFGKIRLKNNLIINIINNNKLIENKKYVERTITIIAITVSFNFYN